MSGRQSDPYVVLGVKATVTDAELRSAYRKLVLKHHPDHNAGSAESTRRFEEIQDAYARARDLRAGKATGRRAGTSGGRSGPSSARPTTGGSGVEDRIAAMERELREARETRERELREAKHRREAAAFAAHQAAAAAAAESTQFDEDAAARKRARDEELGIYSTDDSFSRILSDARTDITEIFGRAISAAERAAQEAARRAGERRENRD